MHYFFLLFLSTIIWLPNSNAQIQFHPTTDLVDVDGFRSGAPIGISDLNGNLLDDVFRLHNARNLQVDFQQTQGKFKTVLSNVNLNNDFFWSIAAADLNNDGLLDIVSSTSFGTNLHLRQSSFGEFSIETLDGIQPFFAQASNFFDINNDGFNDLFVCDDLAESKIWGNDGNGNLTPRNEWIDMATTPPSDNSGNYGSVWADVNGNGLMDLYISKCRGIVNDPEDPRRINALFLNMGNGEFIEAAAELGIASGAQSWAADFADVRNIGYNDFFLINHDRPSIFYRNNGEGLYIDATSEVGIGNHLGHIQIKFLDLDNDGFLDLMFTGNGMTVYRNLGDGTFDLMPNPFDQVPIASFSVGDLNNNGFLDIYASYGSGYNTPSDLKDDLVWLNPGNNNNWLRIKLNGTASNRDGIGAIVRVYSDLGMQTREARAGESYGIQSSNILHFGMAGDVVADSLIIKWPSGIEDRYYDIDTRNIYLATEGICLEKPLNIEYEGDLLLCDKDFVTLTLPDAYAYQWNTGQTSQSIEANAEGIYFARLFDENGCETPTEVITVIEDADFTPILHTVFEPTICSGSSIILGADAIVEPIWSNGKVGYSIEATEEGWYYAEISNSCGKFVSDSVYIQKLLTELPIVTTEGIQTESEVTLTAEGDHIRWYLDIEDEIPAFEGFDWPVMLNEGDNIFYVSNTTTFEGENYRVGKPNFSGSNNYHANHLNGALIFNVTHGIHLNSVKVYTDLEGPRVFTLLNRSSEVILRDTVHIADAENGFRVHLNWDLPVDNDLRMTTDADFNLMTFGHQSPRLFRSNNGISYPYEVEPYVNIYTSSFGQDNYYYFYDWEISLSEKICESDRKEIVINLDTGVNTSDHSFETDKIIISPNPGSDWIVIDRKGACSEITKIEIMDIRGLSHISLTTDFQTTERINTSDLLPGVYILRAEMCGGRSHQVWVKQ
ncbi:MAG: T9SS C-terminal target domain-containing protein [Saprospirales bacterium]|nr:MAG: T9SS C-terminal target domain-containing protein [Saprospirales bacterium]